MSPQSHALAVDVDRSDQLLALSRTSLVSSDSRSISSRLRSSTNLDEIDGVGVLSRNAAEYRLQVGIGNVSIDVHMAAAAPSERLEQGCKGAGDEFFPSRWPATSSTPSPMPRSRSARATGTRHV